MTKKTVEHDGPTCKHLFPLGQIVATPAVISLFGGGRRDRELVRDAISDLLERHARGDWGNVCAEDWRANEDALRLGLRLFSSYVVLAGPPEEKVWIITEADRSITTILLPNDY